MFKELSKEYIKPEQKDNEKENKDKGSEKKEREIYTEILKDVLSKLDDSHLDWRLVGGVALSFYLNEVPNPRRYNGSIRDLDIIVLDYQSDKIKKMENFFEKEMAVFNNAHLDAPIYPEVSFSPVKSRKNLEESDKAVPQLVPHILRDDSRFFLQFRDILEEIDPKILEPRLLEVKTEKGLLRAQSVDYQTLLHQYFSRIGFIKPKDIDKLKDFLRKVRQMNISETEEHKLYLPYHRFARRIRERHKVTNKLLQLYNLIDYKLFNSALTHKLIPSRIIKTLLEL